LPPGDDLATALAVAATGQGAVRARTPAEPLAGMQVLLDADAALVTVLRIKKAPTKKVLIKMGCVYPCASSADITRLLKALTPDQWVRLSFDLKCFSDGGLDVARVDTPFLMTTRGAMSLSIADISVIPGLGPDATIRCRK
jgi:beta-glucosidase